MKAQKNKINFVCAMNHKNFCFDFTLLVDIFEGFIGLDYKEVQNAE